MEADQPLVWRDYQPHALSPLPEEFLCPLSDEVMLDPVMVAESGAIFQRSAIEAYFAKCEL